MTKVSKSEQLRILAQKYPDWTYDQYAQKLGQSLATIRSILSKAGMSRHKRGRPKKVVEARQVQKSKSQPPAGAVFSKAGPRSFGYIKLM